MRRILLLVAVVAMLAAMVVVMAGPALAKVKCQRSEPGTITCQGGEGYGKDGGGYGNNTSVNVVTGERTAQGGSGSGGGFGGSGSRCQGNDQTQVYDCVGGGK